MSSLKPYKQSRLKTFQRERNREKKALERKNPGDERYTTDPWFWYKKLVELNEEKPWLKYPRWLERHSTPEIPEHVEFVLAKILEQLKIQRIFQSVYQIRCDLLADAEVQRYLKSKKFATNALEEILKKL